MYEPVPVTFVSSHARQGGAERYLETLVGELGPRWTRRVVCLEPGPLAGSLADRGTPVTVLPTGAGPAAIARSAWRLRRLLAAERPAVVHANGVKAALVAVLATTGRRLPVVWVKHDFSWDGKLTGFVAARSREVIGVSEAVTEALPARVRHKTHVVHNGLEPLAVDREAARELLLGLLAPPRPVSVVTLVGRIDPNKGHRELLGVAPGILERRPGTVFAFVGGEHEPHLEFARALRHEVDAGGLGRSVRFLGHREDARGLIAGSDVLVVPTVVDEQGFGRESFSLVALEAMAAGTPVTGYADGGLPEVVGECGLLVPPGNRAALADAIVHLLEDSALRERLAACGRGRAVSEFSLERMVEEMKLRYRAAALRP